MPMPKPSEAERAAYELLVEQVAHEVEVKASSMFGMPTAKNASGKALFGVRAHGMVFKLVDPDDRARALALPGATHFDPSGKRPMREWVSLGNEHEEHFLEFALAAARGIAAGWGTPRSWCRSSRPPSPESC